MKMKDNYKKVLKEISILLLIIPGFILITFPFLMEIAIFGIALNIIIEKDWLGEWIAIKELLLLATHASWWVFWEILGGWILGMQLRTIIIEIKKLKRD